MKKLLFIIALVSTTLFSCKQEKDVYHLSGKIDGLDNQEMVLQFVTFNNIEDIDTTKSDKDGNYEFTGKVAEPGFYRIASNGKYWLVRLDNENIVYNAKFDDDFLEKAEVKENDKAIAFQEAINFFIEKQRKNQELSSAYQTKSMAGASQEELKAIEDEFAATQEDLAKEIKERVNKTTDPITGIYYLSGLQNPDDIDYIKTTLADYKKIMPASTYITDMEAQIKQQEDAKVQQAAMEAAAGKIAIGSEAPDFTQKNPQGKDVKLSDYRGKVVLLDFWASWCKPCRYENPNVVAAYNKYKDKGFTVFSVSLDKDRDAWLKAIEQDGLVWPAHVSDLQFWNNAVAKEYGITGIPAAFLVDKNGIIVAKDLRGDELVKKLEEVL
ncbi:MAG: TlpA disulfide reductase family protein [Chitinophagales bacterium]